MPCFKGLAVSIHTNDGPLPEHSIQRLSKFSRINAYIPVPPPKASASSLSGKPEQSTFAISITLLTPGLSVPYSAPKPTPENPYPRPQIVGGLPGLGNDRGRNINTVGPYQALTASPNETVAAYIYFDGRQKEEVATLLRRGEETWVNSRWVSVPESEGGGLAEREFLFREVGLERWLNGLDLEGSDTAAKIERRRQKMERRRRKRRDSSGSTDEERAVQWKNHERFDKGVLRYGVDEHLPLQKVSDEDDMFTSDDDSDDDPVPEATGQIKVALFRVLASGEIKKGEYSPQFDAHDDDEDASKSQNGNGGEDDPGKADIDHTTSFAKPKTLDPKSISTQTVTGIDGPDKPYAVFTFLYRGEKQLQKMGILRPQKSATPKTSSSAKRRSVQSGFANLKPLKAGGALGFVGVREEKGKKKADDEMESDDEEGSKGQTSDVDGEDATGNTLSPDDVKQQGEIAEGVKKIKLKRQHSFDPPTPGTSAPATRRSPSAADTPPAGPNREITPPPLLTSATYDPLADKVPEANVGSPLKKQRASMSGLDSEFRKASADAVASGLGFAFSEGFTDGGFNSELKAGGPGSKAGGVPMEEEEEL